MMIKKILTKIQVPMFLGDSLKIPHSADKATGKTSPTDP